MKTGTPVFAVSRITSTNVFTGRPKTFATFGDRGIYKGRSGNLALVAFEGAPHLIPVGFEAILSFS